MHSMRCSNSQRLTMWFLDLFKMLPILAALTCCAMWNGYKVTAAIVKNVTLISVHVGDNPLYGYRLARPAYEVAVKHIKMQYPLTLGNLQYYSVFQSGYDACTDGADHAAETFIQFYYSHPEIFESDHVYPVMTSPECSSQVMQLADLVREYDLPFFTGVAGDLRLTNKARYSTTGATASLAGPDVRAAIVALLNLYSWRTITIICDTLSRHTGLSNFFVMQCGDIRKIMIAEKYPGYIKEIDSSVGEDYIQVLQSFKDRSRVFVFLTMPVYLRRLMITAHMLNMTSGGFIFLTLQPTERPGIAAVHWNQKDDQTNNAIAFQAYKSLIVLTGMNPNWTEIKTLTDELAAERTRLFNMTTLPGNEKNEQITSVYESTMMFAQIFNESYPDVFAMPKSAFVRTYFNREFNFAGRKYTTDSNGGMVNYIVVSRLNVNTTTMDVAMIYNATARTFVDINPDLWYWVNRSSPPPDKPVCGLSERECDTSHIGAAIKTGTSVAAAVIIMVAGASFAYCRTKRRHELYNPWWILESEKVSFGPRLEVFHLGNDLGTNTKRIVELKLGIIAKYNSRDIYALHINSHAGVDVVQCVNNNQRLLSTFHQLHSIQHLNVARVGGIVRYTADYFLITEYGSKATLRQLIERDHLPIEKDLKLSLLWDLVEGLHYLHQSPVGLHGNVNSLSCILDARYGLKIAQAKYAKILNLLQVPKNPELEWLESLWKSPELLSTIGDRSSDPSVCPTKESDVYSLAVIFFELCTRSLPYGVSLDSLDSIKEAIMKIAADGGFRMPTVSDTVIPDGLQYLLRSCLGQPGKRPTVQLFKKHFRIIWQRPTAYLVHVMKELEKQNRELEKMVVERNRELETEMHKADMLLKKMLPVAIVRQLRNKQPVIPEFFDNATIMFCDIPVFLRHAGTSSPMTIINFLNMVYSHFDHLIESFEVYKVETVNDSYLIASGLPTRNGTDHASEIGKLAISLVKSTSRFPDVGFTEQAVLLRVGINSGSVVAGVIGRRMPRYCLFGDTMNTASRMESHGEGGKIHISMETKQIIQNCNYFAIEPREPINIKGKGIMQTFWLRERTFISLE